MIQSLGNVKIVAETGDGREAFELARSHGQPRLHLLPGQPVEQIDKPEILASDPVLLGFKFDFKEIL
jgi:hypothetical protein